MQTSKVVAENEPALGNFQKGDAAFLPAAKRPIDPTRVKIRNSLRQEKRNEAADQPYNSDGDRDVVAPAAEW